MKNFVFGLDETKENEYLMKFDMMESIALLEDKKQLTNLSYMVRAFTRGYAKRKRTPEERKQLAEFFGVDIEDVAE